MLLSPFNHLCGKGIEFRNKQKNIIHNTHIDKNNNELNIDFFWKRHTFDYDARLRDLDGIWVYDVTDKKFYRSNIFAELQQLINQVLKEKNAQKPELTAKDNPTKHQKKR